ncbi:hypothetical protein [Clostridium mobile]|nr:hypothetical protein [Clostridium mobile]
MELIDWADEVKRLYFEGYTLDEARVKVKKMMKEQERRELCK